MIDEAVAAQHAFLRQVSRSRRQGGVADAALAGGSLGSDCGSSPRGTLSGEAVPVSRSAPDASTAVAVAHWLAGIELSKYGEALMREGFDSLTRMALLDESALREALPDMPVGHRRHLLLCCTRLRLALSTSTATAPSARSSLTSAGAF